MTLSRLFSAVSIGLASAAAVAVPAAALVALESSPSNRMVAICAAGILCFLVFACVACEVIRD